MDVLSRSAAQGGEPALREARANGQRPRIDVQWGRHGSMPVGWRELTIGNLGDAVGPHAASGTPGTTLLTHNQDAYRTLHEQGRRRGDDPRAHRGGWPLRFEGTWDDFARFPRLVDPADLLARRRMVKVSRWNSATIQQHFLAYNFRPKTEWPPDWEDAAAGGARHGAATVEAATLAAFDLPAGHARVVWTVLESEGCDFEAGLEHLQPWQDRAHRALQHTHALHVRYYHTALARQGLHRVRLTTAVGQREFYRFAASGHYEVEHTNPNHADVEICPICERAGAYANEVGNLVERVHDPLGLELVLRGTIRGDRVRLDDHDGRELRGVAALTSQLSVEACEYAPSAADQNTQRLAVVVVAPPGGR